MGPTAMFIAVPGNIVITDADLEDPIAWITPLLHATKANRVYPFFGQVAPISSIKPENQSDVIITLDDGTPVLVRYGIYGRTFETIKGGLCYAKALQSLNDSGWNLIEIDQSGRGLLKRKSDGNYTALVTTFMYSPSPLMADGKSNVYTNRFQMSMSPQELVLNGEIFTGFDVLLPLMGLIDSKISSGDQVATITELYIKVKTECAETDLIDLLGTALGTHADNFSLEDVAASGTPVTITAAAIVGGEIKLSATLVSGHTYRVFGAAPATWLANGIEGYDAEASYVDILIP